MNHPTAMSPPLLREYFLEAGRPHGTVVLNWRKAGPAEIVAYAVAYKNAAQSLIAKLERSIGYQDHCAFPIVFMYRHAVELYLKAFAFRSARTLLAECELEVALPKLWREHSLPKLLQMADLVVRQLKPPAPSAVRCALPSAAEFIDQLHELDPGSYSFRYPVGTTGLPVFESTLCMNLLVFAEHADAALDELSGACIYLEERFISTTEIKLAFEQLTEGGAR